MNKVFLSAFLLLLIFQVSNAKAAAPKLGEPAPPLKLTGLLQASGKIDENIKSLQGKVVVLEFWATWCAPCIAAMPHLNELSEKYKSKGVQFISITDEVDAKTKLFLKKRNINGWVGLDGDKTMHEAYEINAIPFTVVIGTNGTVVGYPKSNTLSEAMLDRALAGEKLSDVIALPETGAPKSAGIEPSKPIYELSIRPSSNKSTFNMIGPNLYKTTGASALDIIKIAFDATLKQTKLAAQLPEGSFDVVATNPGKSSPNWAWRAQLQKMLQDVWEIDVRQENKVVEVYELIASPAATKRLQKADPKEIFSHQSSEEGILAGSNISIDILAKTLQDIMAVPVVNINNISGNYDYNLYYDQSKPETLLKSVEEEMGLKLRKVKRPTNFIVISPKQKGSTL